MMNQIVIMEMPHHVLEIATSDEVKICDVFYPTWHMYSHPYTQFCDVFSIDYDEKWVSRISDDRVIIIKFMMKKYVFVAKDLLWHGIGDELIFVTQASQIMKDDENTTFSDINKMSQKLICVVVCVEVCRMMV